MAGYIGNYPTAVPLSGADLTDGIITPAKLSTTLDLSSKTITLPAGVGGKVLQAVTATDSTNRSTTSNTFVTAGNTLSVTITPSSTSNNILVIANTALRSPQNFDVYTSIFRNGTQLGSSNGFLYSSNPTSTNNKSVSMHVLDNPSSTSALTYQVYFKTGGDTAQLNYYVVKGVITAFEIAG